MILSEIVKIENAIEIRSMEKIDHGCTYAIFEHGLQLADSHIEVVDTKRIKKYSYFSFAPKNSIVIIIDDCGEIKMKRFVENDSLIKMKPSRVKILTTKESINVILPEYVNILIDIIMYNNFCKFTGITLKTLLECVVDMTWPSIERQKQVVECEKKIQICYDNLSKLCKFSKEQACKNMININVKADTVFSEIVSIEQVPSRKIPQLDLSVKLNKKMTSKNGVYKLSDMDIEQFDKTELIRFDENIIHLRVDTFNADTDILNDGYYLLEKKDRAIDYFIKPMSSCKLPITVLWFILREYCHSSRFDIRFNLRSIQNIKVNNDLNNLDRWEHKDWERAQKNIEKNIKYEEGMRQFSILQKDICERYLSTRNKIEENDIQEWLEQFAKEQNCNPYSKENRKR